MPTLRQSSIASVTRRYPFYSGCGTFANKPFIHKLAGNSSERVWSRVPGGEVLAPLNDYVGRAAFYAGDLDRKISWICDRIVRPGDTVLDIGANIGMVTIWLSKLVGQNGKVHAFEPNPELQIILEQMLDRNQISNVCLHPIALGAESGSLELRIPKVNAGSASLIRHRNSIDCTVVAASVRPLTEIVAQEGIKSIRLIKIDVEGFEAEVLRGGLEVLATIRPEAILFELNEVSEGSVRDRPVIQILRDCGYDFFSVPRCFLRMRLERFDLDRADGSICNDFLAVPKGKSYEDIAKLVKASV
jgi:FkbM family methyltransferase